MPSPHIDAFIPGEGEELDLQSEKYHIRLKIEYLKEMQGAWIAKFNTIDSINGAFKLVGYSVFTPETDGKKIPFSIEQSYDFTVKDIEGSVWGLVKGTDSFGINQVLEVTDEKGNVIYVPFAEGIVKEIDENNRVIIIDPPDGLKDLNKI